MEGTDATPEEVAEFREIFNLVDLDGGGSIDLDELRELMDLLGMNASKDEMEARDSIGNIFDTSILLLIHARWINTPA